MKQFRTLISLLVCFSFSSFPAYANIKIGAEWYYPPFQISSGTGFEPEFVTMLCKHLKEKCDIIQMGYYQLFTAVDNGTVDIALSGINLPVLAKGHYIHSLAYTSNSGSFMVLKRSGINSLRSLQGKVVGILRETPNGAGIYFNYLNTTYAGKFRIRKYLHIEDLVAALYSGQISASFTNVSTSKYWDILSNNQFKRIGEPVRLGEGFGFIALPKNSALIIKINQQIKILKKDPTFQALHKTYFRTTP